MRNKNIEFTSPKVKKFKRYHGYLIAGALITVASFFLTLVPCQIATSKFSVPGLCKLPNPFINLATTEHYYYGLSNNPITGLFLQFIFALLISYGVVYLFKKLKFKRKNHKIVDFTKK